MNKIIIEFTAEGRKAQLHVDTSIHGASKTQVASYIYSILEELMKIDEDACKMAIGTFMLNTAEEED